LVQRIFQRRPELRVSCPEFREQVAPVLAEDVFDDCSRVESHPLTSELRQECEPCNLPFFMNLSAQ
jgi:hypothetical protein